MSEITIAKYSDGLVDEMVNTYTNIYMKGEMNSRELHQSWKSTMAEDLGALHAFKRQKTVFQGNLVKAKKMIQVIDDQAEKEVGQKRRKQQGLRKGCSIRRHKQTMSGWQGT